MSRLVFRLSVLAVLILSLPLAFARAELWRSPLASQTYYQIHKQVLTVEADDGATVTTFAPLPAAVISAIGTQALDYEAFVAAYVADSNLPTLEEALKNTDLVFSIGFDRTLSLPHRSFDPLAGSPARVDAAFPAGFAAAAIPNLYLLQFAYPPKESWHSDLKNCGSEVLATLEARTVLLRTTDPAAFMACPISRYYLWIDSYLTTDRISPEMLAVANDFGYDLEYRQQTDLDLKQSALPSTAVVDQAFENPETGTRFLGATLALADFSSVAASDPDLLSVAWRGEANYSDERQGQIVAGNYTSQGTVTAPGYAAWLDCPPKLPGAACASLRAPKHQQIVTMFDSGYADATTPFAGIEHHPDLESKDQVQPVNRPFKLADRLIELRNFSNSSGTKDILGHGSMVAGILAGEGRPDFSYDIAPGQPVSGGGRDAQGFFYGSGIAPRSSILVARLADKSALEDTTPGGRHDQALQWARSTASGAHRSLLVNESWNETRNFPTNINPTDVLAVNQYNQKAQFYDARVRDANTAIGGPQPMTVVFSAGNQAWDRAANGGLGGVRYDSVGSPGTAKNVVTVGASASYRPVAPSPPNPPKDCRDDVARFLSEDATNISQIGRFSGRGLFFSAGGSTKLNQVRIKPDVVAPAIRIFSTEPFNSVAYTSEGPGCAKYYPPTSEGLYYTYATGTSFASPVVTGVAALARKWFLDQTPSFDPSPSMVKAALIATADNLGGQVGNDHRPSPNYGWGRVNLGKLVDGRIARFYTEASRSLQATGQALAYERTISDPTRETVITMAWMDPPSDLVGSSQAPLKNVLELKVEEIGTSPLRFYVGNNFNENKSGQDNGASFRFQGSGTILEDRMNNVAVVVIPAGTLPAGRRLRFTVTGKSLQPNSRQFFSLYATNVRFDF